MSMGCPPAKARCSGVSPVAASRRSGSAPASIKSATISGASRSLQSRCRMVSPARKSNSGQAAERGTSTSAPAATNSRTRSPRQASAAKRSGVSPLRLSSWIVRKRRRSSHASRGSSPTAPPSPGVPARSQCRRLVSRRNHSKCLRRARSPPRSRSRHLSAYSARVLTSSPMATPSFARSPAKLKSPVPTGVLSQLKAAWPHAPYVKQPAFVATSCHLGRGDSALASCSKRHQPLPAHPQRSRMPCSATSCLHVPASTRKKEEEAMKAPMEATACICRSWLA
mmetsp:Transcript_115/g.287  ORF Transcript_115/g.287 Transcript_115/m.287 type:complete len:282 (+) Transcript_115:761-1606(+)